MKSFVSVTFLLLVCQFVQSFLPHKILQTPALRNIRASVNEGDDELDLSAFRKRKEEQQEHEEEVEFDGYAMRDVIQAKWGECYDVDFNKVDHFGLRTMYLNVLPFHLGARQFRHETELDYLCHLQAVVEILQKYDQLGYVLYQMEETTKKPRAGTSPLVAVPLRLELTPEQVTQIIGN